MGMGVKLRVKLHLPELTNINYTNVLLCVSGFLYDEFGSFVVPFCFSGLMYLLSGTLCLVVYCMSRGKANLISETPGTYRSTPTEE